jgi:hypothetical protein
VFYESTFVSMLSLSCRVYDLIYDVKPITMGKRPKFSSRLEALKTASLLFIHNTKTMLQTTAR